MSEQDSIQMAAEALYILTVWGVGYRFSPYIAFKRVEEAFAKEAEKAGFTCEEEMQDYMKEIRKEVRGY